MRVSAAMGYGVLTVALALFPSVIVLVAVERSSHEPEAPERPRVKLSTEPPIPSNRVAYEYRAFVALFDRDWFESKRDNVQQSIALFHRQVDRVSRAFPKPALDRLKYTKIWINWRHYQFSKEEHLGLSAAEYVPQSCKWADDERISSLSGKVVLYASDCVKTPREDGYESRYPFILVHELAHAYHDKELGFGNSDVLGAFHEAVQKKLYSRFGVDEFAPEGSKYTCEDLAYACINHREYFAELTVAYLSQNPYFLSNRFDLRRDDPRGFALMARIWGDPAERGLHSEN
jgi:hypothetical protein